MGFSFHQIQRAPFFINHPELVCKFCDHTGTCSRAGYKFGFRCNQIDATGKIHWQTICEGRTDFIQFEKRVKK